MEALCLTAVGGIMFGFPKYVIETIAPFLPAFITENIRENNMCTSCKKPETEEEAAPEPEKELEQPGVPILTYAPPVYLGSKTRKRIQSDENYINCEWKESEVPKRAMELINENIEDEDSYEKITNTCVKLIELFAMYASRRDELSRVRDRVMRVDSDLAEKIDLSRFSQCAFYEGRILLYR